jgi:hypothetical protein
MKPEDEQSMSTIQPDPPDEQDERRSLVDASLSALSAIVIAMLDFLRSTILHHSWVPWFRAMLSVALLAIFVVAVVVVIVVTTS